MRYDGKAYFDTKSNKRYEITLTPPVLYNVILFVFQQQANVKIIEDTAEDACDKHNWIVGSIVPIHFVKAKVSEVPYFVIILFIYAKSISSGQSMYGML